jgi:uncharacterized membrane protein
MTLVMSELSEPTMNALELLHVPAERNMPAEAMQAQKAMLLAAIAEAETVSSARRLQRRLRSMLGWLGFLALLGAVLGATFVLAVTGSANGKRVAELTAATGAITVVAVANGPASRLSMSAGNLVFAASAKA